MNKQILILGNSQDDHALHLYQSLTKKGVKVNFLDTYLFPTKLHLSFNINANQGSICFPDEQQIDWEQIHSIFWRNFNRVGIPQLEDSRQQMLAFNDSISALQSMIKGCPTHWVNSWDAYEFHRHKPLQLKKVHSLGVKIPQTLITNSPQEVRNFVQQQEKVIFKPVYGGATTKPLTAELLDAERLKLALKIAPITLQEYIAGTNIRTFVIGEKVYSAEIRSSYLDFREDKNHELIPITTPELIKKQALALKKALFLEWTAIDWRLTPDGDYLFLEANPSPMFLHFEKVTRFPLTENLIELLLN